MCILLYSCHCELYLSLQRRSIQEGSPVGTLFFCSSIHRPYPFKLQLSTFLMIGANISIVSHIRTCLDLLRHQNLERMLEEWRLAGK